MLDTQDSMGIPSRRMVLLIVYEAVLRILVYGCISASLFLKAAVPILMRSSQLGYLRLYAELQISILRMLTYPLLKIGYTYISFTCSVHLLLLRSLTQFKTATIAVIYTIYPRIRYAYNICSKHFMLFNLKSLMYVVVSYPGIVYLGQIHLFNTNDIFLLSKTLHS